MGDHRKGRVGRLSIRQAAHLYHVLGWSSAEVGEVCGVKANSVLRAFARNGVPRRAGGPGMKVLREDLVKARKRGWTKAGLARHLGVTVKSVYVAQKRFGIAWPARDGNNSPV